MIPVMSARTTGTTWAARMRSSADARTDFERGGVAVGNTSEGLRGYDWTASIKDDGGILLFREDLGAESGTVLVTRPGATRVSLAFDQNMRPVLAWEEPAGCFLWYYRANSAAYESTLIPGAHYSCLTLDERRPELISTSDVILSYTKSDNNLYCRVQREGYNTERLLSTDVPNPQLLAFGMTKQLRLQWRLST